MDRRPDNGMPAPFCENILRDEIEYNRAHAVLPSESRIAALLLARGVEMREVYEELCAKLDRRAVREFLRSVLCTTAFWGPESSKRERKTKKSLEDLNSQIAEQAEALATLLEERDHIQNHSAFNAPTHYHVCDVIAKAASQHTLFYRGPKEALESVRLQYDLKYWPDLGAFMREVSRDAAAARVSASDPLTEASTSSPKASLTDYFRTLFAAIDEGSHRNGGLYPRGFSVTDKSIATIGNCALNLSANQIVDSHYVKRLRQRMRSTTRESKEWSALR